MLLFIPESPRWMAMKNKDQNALQTLTKIYGIERAQGVLDEIKGSLNEEKGINTISLRFFNVYGPKQICKGNMATVIGIFEDQYKNNKPLTVVKPGTQSRKFTHINDTIEACYHAWKKNECKHYSISNRKSYTIIEVAKLFGTKIKLLPPRKGERYASALTSMNLSNKVNKMFGKIDLKDYISNIVKNS